MAVSSVLRLPQGFLLGDTSSCYSYISLSMNTEFYPFELSLK